MEREEHLVLQVYKVLKERSGLLDQLVKQDKPVLQGLMVLQVLQVQLARMVLLVSLAQPEIQDHKGLWDKLDQLVLLEPLALLALPDQLEQQIPLDLQDRQEWLDLQDRQE
jgi:hypothetical protein